MEAALALILKLLDTIETLAPAAQHGADGLADVRQRVSQMKAEGREPTDAEWEELNETTSSLTSRLEAANQRLNG